MPDTFVLNDENTVNSYGFRTKNKGIDLERFKANPVILAQHANNVWMVIGRWENIRIEGSKLLADAVFDMEDPEAALIAGKVQRGFLKGVSMGLFPVKDSWVLAPDGNYDLMESELWEASIVAIPSNKSSVRLFAKTGEVMADEQIKLSLSAVQEFIDNTKIPNMEKITLNAVTLLVLGLQNTENPLALGAAIEKLATDHKALQEQYKELAAKVEADKMKAAKALAASALASGKITADEVQRIEQLAVADYALAQTTVELRPGKTNLAGQVNNPAANAGKEMTLEAFVQLSTDEQLAWRASNPALYQKMVS